MRFIDAMAKPLDAVSQVAESWIDAPWRKFFRTPIAWLKLFRLVFLLEQAKARNASLRSQIARLKEQYPDVIQS